MNPWLRRAYLLVRRIARELTRFSLWTTEGLRRRGARATGVRLLALGLVVGWLVGWANGKVIHVVTETELPRPVTPPPPGTSWVKVKTTGYCPCWRCCGWDATGTTSTGRKTAAHPYGIAVDRKLIPYGTRLAVPGYGEAEVDDTGGAMRQAGRRGTVHIDLRYRTHAEAAQWGVRWLWLALPRGIPATP